MIKLFPDLEEVDSRFLFSGSLETAENVFLNYGFKPTIVGSSEEEEDEEDEESGEVFKILFSIVINPNFF